MSTALNPGLWYSSIVNYKRGSAADHTLIAALIAAFLTTHERSIEEVLEGPLSHIVVVPSTRGRPFGVHPLAVAVRRSSRFRDRLVDGLAYVPGSSIARQQYKPDIYTASPSVVANGRIVVIEDLWVSGAKAVSGAGALLDAGARSVAILPVAREIRESVEFCPEEYVREIQTPFDIDRWPR